MIFRSLNAWVSQVPKMGSGARQMSDCYRVSPAYASVHLDKIPS